MWRVWFRSLSGTERYFDVEAGPFPADAIRKAHERFRAEPGKDPMRGWWMDRWQALIVPAGTKRPPLLFRLRWAWRRLTALNQPGPTEPDDRKGRP
jgi:hypothetical protein